MRQWLIPAVVLIAVGLTGIGVGWSVNEWQGGDETSAPAQAGRTQAELDAQLCAAALQAAGQFTSTELGVRWAMEGTEDNFPRPVQQALDRYC